MRPTLTRVLPATLLLAAAVIPAQQPKRTSQAAASEGPKKLPDLGRQMINAYATRARLATQLLEKGLPAADIEKYVSEEIGSAKFEFQRKNPVRTAGYSGEGGTIYDEAQNNIAWLSDELEKLNDTDENRGDSSAHQDSGQAAQTPRLDLAGALAIRDMGKNELVIAELDRAISSFGAPDDAIRALLSAQQSAVSSLKDLGTPQRKLVTYWLSMVNWCPPCAGVTHRTDALRAVNEKSGKWRVLQFSRTALWNTPYLKSFRILIDLQERQPVRASSLPSADIAVLQQVVNDVFAEIHELDNRFGKETAAFLSFNTVPIPPTTITVVPGDRPSVSVLDGKIEISSGLLTGVIKNLLADEGDPESFLENPYDEKDRQSGRRPERSHSDDEGFQAQMTYAKKVEDRVTRFPVNNLGRFQKQAALNYISTVELLNNRYLSSIMFMLTHEFGHIVLGHSSDTACPARETNADSYAAVLLLQTSAPIAWVSDVYDLPHDANSGFVLNSGLQVFEYEFEHLFPSKSQPGCTYPERQARADNVDELKTKMLEAISKRKVSAEKVSSLCPATIGKFALLYSLDEGDAAEALLQFREAYMRRYLVGEREAEAAIEYTFDSKWLRDQMH